MWLTKGGFRSGVLSLYGAISMRVVSRRILGMLINNKLEIKKKKTTVARSEQNPDFFHKGWGK
jgi:hypothetical protein